MALTPQPDTMLTSAIRLPEFNVFALQFGDFGIRWYALAYIAGLLVGLVLLKRGTRAVDSPVTSDNIDSLLNYLIVGLVLGGRFGYVLFYNTHYFIMDPLAIFRVWEGGMSFHGALIGIYLALWLMAYRCNLPLLTLSDRVAMVAPIGLFFGRLANFINGELYGRVTDVSWAMIFPHSDGQPRHPSQLYEAGLEGLLLGLVMLWCWRRGGLATKGRMTGLFCLGYGTARFLVELVREPDPQIGLLLGVISMGQLLTLPMIAAGLVLLLGRRPLGRR